MIGIDKENLFRFVITYKPISENFLTNMLVDFKIAKSEQALNKVSDMLFLGDEIIVKSVDKNYINNQSFLVINGINKSERDLLLRMYMMVKKDFALGITGATSKKYFEEDSIALKRIVYGIDIPQEVNVIKSKALDEYRWSMITKNNGTNIYIDFDSIKIKNNKEVDMWVAYEEEETTLVCLNKFYLDSREYSNLSLVKYDNVSGKVIDSYSSRYASREYLIPGSVIEMVFGCAGVYYELNK